VKLGPHGESIAARHLKRSGFRIVTRNYSCPLGEIDIIAVDDDTLVFVEVKARSSTDSADPEDRVDRRKQRHLTLAAKFYISAKSAQDLPCRFDVVTVVAEPGAKPVVEHFIDAFEASF
jgi:putative endonuclease